MKIIKNLFRGFGKKSQNDKYDLIHNVNVADESAKVFADIWWN